MRRSGYRWRKKERKREREIRVGRGLDGVGMEPGGEVAGGKDRIGDKRR